MGVASGNLSTRPPASSIVIAPSRPRSASTTAGKNAGRFKRAFYINPDTQYDKGNEWVDYFNNVFVK